MRWSKLHSLVIERFAEPLQGRLDIQSTRYGNCSCGHAWLTLDGAVIANFCTRAHHLAQVRDSFEMPPNAMYRSQFTAYGEMSRQGAYEACWAFVHELAIEQAVASRNPLIQTLGVADSRIGRRRLAMLIPKALHPLARHVLAVRTVSLARAA